MSESNSADECLELKLHLKGHKKAITSLSFHPTDHKQFASGSEDNSIMVWNVAQNVRSYNFLGHKDAVTCVEYSPDGKVLASCSQDQTVRLWVPTITGGCSEFRAHTSPIRTLAFAPDNTKLITGANDKAMKLWNVAKRQFISSFTGHNNWIRCVQFSRDGNTVVSCSDDRTVRIWDPKSSECTQVLHSASKGSPMCVSIHRNGNSVAIALDSGSVRVYDIRTKKLQQHYVLHDCTMGVCWHPNANYLLSCGKDGKLIVVDVMEGRPLYTIGGHKGGIVCVKFNADGEYFASGGEDRHILVWKTDFNVE